MVFLEIMSELKLKTVRSARFKGVRGRKTGRVCKAVVRQGREAHNRVNICLKYRDLRGSQDFESFICNFKIPGHKYIFNSGS